MKFERIEILNFASYYGENRVDLSTTDEKPVIIFLGGTGYGKTSLFDAINWSLYGVDYEKDLPNLRRGRNILDYVNETALREALVDKKSVDMSCTLYFTHNSQHYYITQALSAKPIRDEQGVITAQQTDRITTLYEILRDGNHKKKPYDNIFLNEILPSNVKDYFLFDGDRIYNLTKPEASQEVQDAIYRVVDLELLQNAQNHLVQVATEYRRQAKREATGALGDIQSKYNDENDNLSRLKTELQTYKSEKQAIDKQLSQLEAKLINLPDTSQLQGQRKQLEDQLKNLEKDINQVKIQLRTQSSTAILHFASAQTTNLISILDSKRKTGEIPKAVSQTLLKDLLKIQRCLCGTQFEEGDKVHQTLERRLQEEKAKSGRQELLSLLMSLQTAQERITNNYDQLRQEDERLRNLRERRIELGRALDQIDTQLAELPKEDVAELAKQAKERRDDLVSTEGKIQRTQSKIEACEERIKEIRKQRDELSKQQAKVRSLQRRENLAQQAADEIDKIYDVFAENSRQAVETLTIKEFKHFVPSSSTYQVSLSEDYELIVLDSNGNRALQRLSMGQSQCLSLAFITAISRVSEKNPPLAIDMPFGRLDFEVHDSVSARLPELTNQLILFLIPGAEWNEVTTKNLSHKARYIYQLNFDNSNRQTEIVEVRS